jgi:hypothetical protein
MGTWYIDSNLNQGYPTWTDFITAPTGWTDTGDVPLNKLAWRIRSGVNEGYPFLGYWFDSSSGQQGGEMEIGGSQTNYPNGFTDANRGNIRNQFNPNTMDGNSYWVTTVNNQIATAFSGKAFVIDDEDVTRATHAICDDSLYSATLKELIQSVYGANVFQGIQMCRCFPFSLEKSANTPSNPWDIPMLYGKLQLMPARGGCTKFFYTFDMGFQNIRATQAWEFENVEYSIYLPYAGTFPLDVRSAEEFHLYLNVDILNNVGEYVLQQNGQVVNCWKCIIGYDIPIDLSRGATMQNAFGMVANTVGKGLGLLSTVTGAALGGPGGAIAGSAVGSIMDSVHATEHYNVSAPQVGSLSGSNSYPRARIIAKVPKMHRDGYGYAEILGENRSTGYLQLRSCSGFTQCVNYKCDVIVATTEEKQEIESLMNAGVFL